MVVSKQSKFLEVSSFFEIILVTRIQVRVWESTLFIGDFPWFPACFFASEIA